MAAPAAVSEPRGAEPAIRRITKPIWVTLRVRLLFSWLPGPALQWIRHLLYSGRLLPLNNPRTYTERLMVKLARDRNPLLTRTADRVALRGYVEERLGPGHLPALLAVLNTPDQLLGADLSPRYVVKATHGSQMTAIVDQDSLERRITIARRARGWLRTDYWRRHGEWAYRHVPKRLVVEEHLGAADGTPPPDWKFYCFGGSVALVALDLYRGVGARRNFYLPTGEQVDVVMNHRFPPGPVLPVPASFQAMRQIAERLGADFDAVRVDLYSLPGRIVVGELTHYPAAGLTVWDPPSWDVELGERWAHALAARGSA